MKSIYGRVPKTMYRMIKGDFERPCISTRVILIDISWVLHLHGIKLIKGYSLNVKRRIKSVNVR